MVNFVDESVAKKIEGESTTENQLSKQKSPSPEPDKEVQKECTQDMKPEAASAEKDDTKEEKEEEYTSPELEKYWKAVKENPADFTGWTYLLQYVEQEVKHSLLVIWLNLTSINDMETNRWIKASQLKRNIH